MEQTQQGWAVVLGASSGFGSAVARELAARGINICGVHLDRRSTIAAAEETKSAIEAAGVEALFFNVNAVDGEKRRAILDALSPRSGRGGVRLLFHSLAFGSLVPLIADDPRSSASARQIAMTLEVMANSLVYWSQDLVWRGLLGEGGRILAMSSAGSTRATHGYGVVSAAKSALEAYVRQLAVELGPRGIAVNTIRAGVTDTAALRKIPGSEGLKAHARTVNPGRRLTEPVDVARAVALLIEPGAAWISGNVIGVDGGEDVAAG